MKKSYIYIVVLILVSVMVFTGCSSEESSEEPNIPSRTFTLEELSEYDGKDGREAYVAVDGLVYDFSELDMWPDGDHNGFEAGNDLTEEIKEISPHGVSVLDRAPVVGTLEE